MNPQNNIMQDAKQTLQGAQGAAPAPGPQMPQSQGLPVPPAHVAMQLAQVAQTLDPMVLGTLIWRALKQHGEAMNSQGMNDLGAGAQSPQMTPIQ